MQMSLVISMAMTFDCANLSICQSVTVYYFHQTPKRLPHKQFKNGGSNINTYILRDQAFKSRSFVASLYAAATQMIPYFPKIEESLL